MAIVFYVPQGRGKRRRGAPEEPFLRLLLVRQGMSGGGQMGVWVEHHVHLSLPDFIITRSVHMDKTKLCFRSSLSNPTMLFALLLQFFVYILSFETRTGKTVLKTGKNHLDAAQCRSK